MSACLSNSSSRSSPSLKRRQQSERGGGKERERERERGKQEEYHRPEANGTDGCSGGLRSTVSVLDHVGWVPAKVENCRLR